MDAFANFKAVWSKFKKGLSEEFLQNLVKLETNAKKLDWQKILCYYKNRNSYSNLSNNCAAQLINF